MSKVGLNAGVGLAILRVVLGVIFIAHGWPKLAGGIGGTADFFASLDIPAATAAAWVIALLETVGGVMLIAGILVTPVAILLALHMITGMAVAHAPNGFYVIGPGSGGIEFNLIMAAACITLVFAGPGAGSVDGMRAARSPAA